MFFFIWQKFLPVVAREHLMLTHQALRAAQFGDDDYLVYVTKVLDRRTVKERVTILCIQLARFGHGKRQLLRMVKRRISQRN